MRIPVMADSIPVIADSGPVIARAIAGSADATKSPKPPLVHYPQCTLGGGTECNSRGISCSVCATAGVADIGLQVEVSIQAPELPVAVFIEQIIRRHW